MTQQHSFLPPSGAASWKQCAMWPTMNKLYPQDDTPESLEGNAAHWVAWEMMASRYHDVGAKAPNGIMVTEEMIEGAELLIDTVGKKTPNLLYSIEKRVDIPRIHKDCWGTPDLWAFDKSTHTLDVFDYKFGHRFVDEFENDQGISYIAGLIDEIVKTFGVLEEKLAINFTIVQPRCFQKGSPVRTWSTRSDKLKLKILELERAAKVAHDPNPLATTNTECGDCPGHHACAALQEAGYSDCEYAMRSSPVELPPTAAALELRIMERCYERLGARVEGLRESVLANIRQGHPTPWYKAEQQYGRTTWTVPVEQVIAMGDLMGVKLAKVAVITPNQAEKAGIDESVIKAYSITPPGKLKLEPLNPSDAARVFGTN